MLKTAAMIAAPILVSSLVVGLLISIFQVVTQIQEMSLTFVPKLMAAVFVIIVFGNWMMSVWLTYTTELLRNIPDF
jgi:flagellar biosynthetic protein FliQ